MDDKDVVTLLLLVLFVSLLGKEKKIVRIVE